jgi:hypothetical protein
LLKATTKTLKRRGLSDTAKLITEATKSPGRPSKMRRRLEFGRVSEDQTTFTPDEALLLLLELSLTKDKYRILRNACIEKGHKTLFPSYVKVLKAKDDCRSDPSSVQITETQAEGISYKHDWTQQYFLIFLFQFNYRVSWTIRPNESCRCNKMS